MRVPRLDLAAAGAALILLGAGLVLAAALASGTPTVRAAGDDRPVNEGAGDLGDISAHNSPAVARNPREPENVAVASRIDGPRFSCALHVSFDGGARWRRTAVPIPAGEQRKCYAPDVSFAADGTLHLSYVTLRGAGNVPHAVWVARSRDGGRTLEAPTRVSGPRAFQVRIAADPGEPRRLYLTWLQAREVGPLRFTTSGNPIVITRSEDGGRTWDRPVRVSSPRRSRVLAPSPAVGRRGEVYVLFLDVRGDRLDYHGGHDGFGGPPYAGRHELVLARRLRGSRRWGESVVDDAVIPVERFVAFIAPFPSLAVDRRSGRVFVGYHDGRRGSADVAVWTLDPAASRWRGPAGVDDTGEGDRSAQTLPQLAVGDDGRLDVVYYDRRADPRDVRTEVSLQSSFDAGRTFGPRVRLSSKAFDSRVGFGSERGMPDRGSRLGLVSGAGALAVWSDTRHGSVASNKQDLMAARVEVTEHSEVADALRAAGFAVGAGGVAALVLVALRHRRGATRR